MCKRCSYHTFKYGEPEMNWEFSFYNNMALCRLDTANNKWSKGMRTEREPAEGVILDLPDQYAFWGAASCYHEPSDTFFIIGG